MAITSSVGLASGLNIDSIISSLTAFDNQQLQQINNQKSTYQQQISAYGTLLNALSSFKDATTPLETADVLGLQAVSSNPSVLTATATTSAAAGTYNIQVNQTAQAQSVYSHAYSDASTVVVGTGTLTIQIGNAAPVNISITSANDTLNGISTAINQANAGVTSSVINDGTGYRLTVTSNTSGAANIIKISAQDDDGNNTDMNGLSALAFDSSNNITNMTQSIAPQDANIVLNGISVTRSTNTISDLINGVTLNLNNNSAGSTVLSVSNDTAGLLSKVKAFVSAYNQTMGTMTGTSVAGTPNNNGPIYGSSIVNSITNSMMNVTTDNDANSSLALIGITHDKNGVLQVDSNMLSSAVASNPQQVVSILNAMSTTLDNTLTNYIATSIPSQQDTYNTDITDLTTKANAMQENLNNETTNLRNQYAVLESTISQLQSEGSYITQTFAAWSYQASSSSGSGTGK